MFSKDDLYLAIKEAFQVAVDNQDASYSNLSEAYILLGTLKSAIIAAWSYMLLNDSTTPDLDRAIAFYREKKLLQLNKYECISNDAKAILEEVLNGKRPNHKALCDMHQSLTGIDVSLEDGLFNTGITKNQRDASGSYFTPKELAEATTKHAYDLLFQQKDRYSESIRIADLSCGAGEFLCAALKNIPADEQIELWAYDVDPSALLIAYSRVRDMLNRNSFPDCDTDENVHFILGNPIYLSTTSEYADDIANKERAFFCGLIYDVTMALPKQAFPDDGFDIILGNPPWEKVRFEEKKFFQLIAPEISALPKRDDRRRVMSEMFKRDRHGIRELYEQKARSYKDYKAALDETPLRYPSGEPNTYVSFVQAGLLHSSANHVVALIIKTALFTAAVNAEYSSQLVDEGKVLEIYLFDNRKKIFPIDGREKFCIAYFGAGKPGEFLASFGNRDIKALGTVPLIKVLKKDLTILNPRTNTLPELETSEEYLAMVKLQSKFKAFSDIYSDSHFGRLVHLTSHARHITQENKVGVIGVYEGKFIGQHDSRYATFEGVPQNKRYVSKATARKMDSAEKHLAKPQPRYFIDENAWTEISKNYNEGLMLCWRSLTSATNKRTMIATLCQFQPACQSVQFLQLDNPYDMFMLAGLFNSKAFDYILRRKIPGIDLTQTVVKQMPVPARSAYRKVISYKGIESSIGEHIIARLEKLYSFDCAVCDALDKVDHYQYSGTNESALDELDELYLGLYGFTDKERAAILQTFD